jgi:hypothetical protein
MQPGMVATCAQTQSIISNMSAAQETTCLRLSRCFELPKAISAVLFESHLPCSITLATASVRRPNTADHKTRFRQRRGYRSAFTIAMKVKAIIGEESLRHARAPPIHNSIPCTVTNWASEIGAGVFLAH